ncbi:MAG: membrane protein insertase YidC [Marinilabiliaceae bacterium]|nr:membrane protein insertase YidC [Marinilabiliaceae bacterium]
MDKNTIVGFLLIALILIGWALLNRPSQEQLEAQRQLRDSLQQAEVMRQLEAEVALIEKSEKTDPFIEFRDSVTVQEEKEQLFSDLYGDMSPYIEGDQEFYLLENEKIKMTLTNKGGKIYSVELKNYNTYEGKPLILFDGNDNKFGFPFVHKTRNYNTNDLYFGIREQSDSKIIFELKSENNEFLAFIYELLPDEYMTRFYIQSRNMGQLVATLSGALEFEWSIKIPSFEKGRKFEQQYSSVYFKYFGDEVNNLSLGRNGSEKFRTKMNWVAFKCQFFSSVFIADEGFTGGSVSAEIETRTNSPFISYHHAEIAVPAEATGDNIIPFRFYFGPNHFYTLKEYGQDLELTRLIALGWGIFGWINKFLVIPVFNYLEKYILNYGLIILILTLIIKTILFPLTYKSYKSAARMKVLKPQIDEINEKIPADKKLERQQATMALYKKAGVNPMGGCVPMLLQMPVLIALFRFLPSSIELRQKSFLWAEDLSAYDSILDLPFTIPMYGAHISLFTLLMAAATIISTKFNTATQPSQQMPGMKMMIYMMPVMLLVIFNSYASGLSYYYFISTLITILQTIAIKQFIDEKKLLATLTANQKKPVKKSGFAHRLEMMAKKQNQLRSQAQSHKPANQLRNQIQSAHRNNPIKQPPKKKKG